MKEIEWNSLDGGLNGIGKSSWSDVLLLALVVVNVDQTCSSPFALNLIVEKIMSPHWHSWGTQAASGSAAG